MRKWLLSAAIAAGLLAPAAAQADEVDYNTGGLTLTGGVDLTTAYVFRGYEQVDDGWITQPWITLAFAAHESDTLTVTPYIGTWHTVAENAPGEDFWYEADFYAGVDVASGPFTLGLIYTLYTYPGDAAENIQEIGARLAYNDAQFAEDVGIPFRLNPHIGVWYEFDDDNEGDSPLADENTYIEVGLTPSFEVGDTDLVLSFPLVLGLSCNDYYVDDDGDNEWLGYGSAGIIGRYPLFTGRYGTWTLKGAGTYVHQFADSAEDSNDGGDDNYELIGTVGLEFAY